MRIWIVEVGEPLPTDPGAPRLMRAGLLADCIERQGHEVVWWTSAFDHYRKVMRPAERVTVTADQGRYDLVTLPALGYERHVSIQRFRDHRHTAKAFVEAARRAPRPDVICASLPTLELAAASAEVAKRTSSPLVVDVQDLWPDVFADALPSRLRPLATVPLAPLRAMARRACRAAVGIVGVSRPFCDWGVRHAGRTATADDRVFPLAYRPYALTADQEADAERAFAALGVERSRRIVAFIGSLTEQFSFDAVVDAAEEIGRHRPDVLFVFAGSGPLEARLRERTARAANIVFTGWLGQDRIAWLLRHATFGLAPYVPSANFLGNLTNKVVEYLSGGLPVITSLPDGPTAELLRDTGSGVTYPVDDGRALAALLGALLDDDARRAAMAERARALFAERFHADRVYADYGTYLADIAARNPVRTRA